MLQILHDGKCIVSCAAAVPHEESPAGFSGEQPLRIDPGTLL